MWEVVDEFLLMVRGRRQRTSYHTTSNPLSLPGSLIVLKILLLPRTIFHWLLPAGRGKLPAVTPLDMYASRHQLAPTAGTPQDNMQVGITRTAKISFMQDICSVILENWV